MIYVHMVEINPNMRFLLSLGMLEIIGVELELEQFTWNQKTVKLSLLI